MRIVLQRVKRGSVTVEGKRIAEIGYGLVLLVGVGPGDNAEKARALAEKVAYLRIFEDEAGKMNLSVRDVGGAAIVVSQFTLYANLKKGTKPSFTEAKNPKEAKSLYEKFYDKLIKEGYKVKTGSFGEYMQISLENDGPVTFNISSNHLHNDSQI